MTELDARGAGRRQRARPVRPDRRGPPIAESIRRGVRGRREEVTSRPTIVARSGTRARRYLLCGARVECHGGHYLCGMGLDISERRAPGSMLRLRERALHAASNGIVITRCDGPRQPDRIRQPGFRAHHRLQRRRSASGAIRASWPRPAWTTTERAQLREAIARAPSGERACFATCARMASCSGTTCTITPVHDEHGDVTHFIGVINDVTAIKQRTAHLEHEVNHDPLTGLANRNLLWDRLEQAIHLAQRNKTLVATVLLDLNNFKHINDTYGHEAGDEVLRAVARAPAVARCARATPWRACRATNSCWCWPTSPRCAYTLRMIERLRQGHGAAGARSTAARSRSAPAWAWRSFRTTAPRLRAGARGRRRHVPRQGSRRQRRSISFRPT